MQGPPQPTIVHYHYYTTYSQPSPSHVASLLGSARSACGVQWCAFGLSEIIYCYTTSSPGLSLGDPHLFSEAAPHPIPRLRPPPRVSYWSLPPTCIAGGALYSNAPHLYHHSIPTCIITGAQEDALRSSAASPAPTAETHSPHTCRVRAARWRWRQSRREGARQPWQYARMGDGDSRCAAALTEEEEGEAAREGGVGGWGGAGRVGALDGDSWWRWEENTVGVARPRLWRPVRHAGYLSSWRSNGVL